MHHLLNAIIISSWILGDFLFTKMGFLCQVNARFTYYAISLLKIFLLLAASSPSCQSHFKFFFLKIQFLTLESQYQSLYIHFVTSAMILGWVDLTDFIIRMKQIWRHRGHSKYFLKRRKIVHNNFTEIWLKWNKIVDQRKFKTIFGVK